MDDDVADGGVAGEAAFERLWLDGLVLGSVERLDGAPITVAIVFIRTP